MTTNYAQDALQALSEGRTDEAQVLATLAVHERLSGVRDDLQSIEAQVSAIYAAVL